MGPPNSSRICSSRTERVTLKSEPFVKQSFHRYNPAFQCSASFLPGPSENVAELQQRSVALQTDTHQRVWVSTAGDTPHLFH